MHRNLRIAVSVFFGVLTVAMVVLWIRSYWKADSIWRIWANNYSIIFHSKSGATTASSGDGPGSSSGRWRHKGREVVELPSVFQDNLFNHVFAGFQWGQTKGGRAITIPHWFLAGMTIMLAASPWIPATARFSLRTLLIATTLVAVALRLAVWAERS